MTDQKKPIAATKEHIGPTRPPLPPFTRETAIQKVRLAEAPRMPLQYPGEFVPIILWVGGVAGSSLAAQEANRSAGPAAHKIDNQYNCRRLINCINFF